MYNTCSLPVDRWLSAAAKVLSFAVSGITIAKTFLSLDDPAAGKHCRGTDNKISSLLAAPLLLTLFLMERTGNRDGDADDLLRDPVSLSHTRTTHPLPALSRPVLCVLPPPPGQVDKLGASRGSGLQNPTRPERETRVYEQMLLLPALSVLSSRSSSSFLGCCTPGTLFLSSICVAAIPG